VAPGDTFRLEWEFLLLYYDVTQQLRAIRRILEDESLVVEVNLTCDVDSLFLGFIEDLQRCQKAIKERM
jgi:hypothetical protein